MVAGNPTSELGPPFEPDETLGRTLARLRHERDLTSSALARQSGVSQGQISKIENSKSLPSPNVVRQIATALRVPSPLAEDLVEWAHREPAEASRVKFARRSSGSSGQINQKGWMDEESNAVRIRSFELAVVPGLLQTSEYARRVIDGYNEVQDGDDHAARDDLNSTVGVRMERQEKLRDTAVSFEFVFTEAVLRYRFGEDDWPVVMAAQIQRIEEACDLPNVAVRIMPQDAVLSYPPAGAFMIIDDSVVLTESTVGASADRENIDPYVRAFEHFWNRAPEDVLPILKRYKAELVDELTQVL